MSTIQQPPVVQYPQIKKLETPFEHIALAFSGGGFRAAAFGLGTLSFLKQVKFKKDEETTLLEKVTYMSSASGGTIATSVYTLSAANGQSFNEFYKHLHENIDGTCLLEEALRILNDKKAWESRPDKTRNIINAFAMAYDKHLYHYSNVDGLKKAGEKGHLEEVCFNSTELYNGLLFRQTVELKHDISKKADEYLYGNFTINLNHTAADNLRIADLLAASSCFPAGFEPVVFPTDFINPDASRKFLTDNLNVRPIELSRQELELLFHKEKIEKVHNSIHPFSAAKFAEELEKLELKEDFEFCLMDGGITDNQGLESIIQANNRRESGDSEFSPFDLMLICDVGSHYMSAYQLPKESKTSWLSISRLRILSIVLFLIAAAGTWYIWKFLPHTGFWNLMGLVTGMLSFGGLMTFLIIGYIRSFISGKVRNGGGLDLDKNFSPKIVKLLLNYFKYIRLNLLSFMVKERITSVLSLNNDVFLKRIRFLLYNMFFEQKNMKSTGRVKANHIYDLTYTNDINRNRGYTSAYSPGSALQNVAQAAFGMATTLWFGPEDVKKHSQAAVIACGQFTTCYNLLDYIAKLKTKFPGQDGAVFDGFSEYYMSLTNDLEAQLKAMYADFQADPFWLYNKLGKESGISNFQPVSAGDFSLPENFKGLR